MRTKTLLTIVAAAMIGGSFFVGKWYGSGETSEKLMQQETRNWDQFASLDKTVLQTLPARANTMKSGTYVMEMWFANTRPLSQNIMLACTNGIISSEDFSRNHNAEVLTTNGTVVSWTDEGALYEANAKFIGIIDGDEMWGHVYGWNPGEQSVGMWRIYPQAKTGDLTNKSVR